MADSDPATRREWIVVGALTGLAAIVRCWSIGRLGLQHFDEGIYALAGLWMLDPRGLAAIDPTVIPYAPAGFPLLIGVSYFVFGISDLAAIAVSVACGIATIPIVAWLSRRTFGPGAGAAAAALAAVAVPHVAFSRMALTDVPFLLAWLVSLGLGARLLERPGPGRAVVFGLAVGLAQNLKYNGWLAGVIVAVVVVLSLALDRGELRRKALKALGWGLLAGGIAAIVYWPWYRFVDHHGGYAALLAHHRRYVGGLASWWPQWRAQMDQAVALSGGPVWGLAAWSLAWSGWAIVVHGRTLRERTPRALWVRLRMGLIVGLVLLAALPNVSWWIALGALPWYLHDTRPGVRLVGVWWLLLTVLTPFYHPYARLWLPLHAAGWVVIGAFACDLGRYEWPWFLRAEERKAAVARPQPGRRAAVACACLLLGLGARFGLRPMAIPMQGFFFPTDNLKTAVASLMAPPPRPGVYRLLLLARPAVRFYLATGATLTLPVQSVPNLAALLKNGIPGDGAIVDGALLVQDGDLEDELQLLTRERWIVLPGDSADCRLGIPTLLDIDPAAAYEAQPVETLPVQFRTRHNGF